MGQRGIKAGWVGNVTRQDGEMFVPDVKPKAHGGWALGKRNLATDSTNLALGEGRCSGCSSFFLAIV